MGQLRGMGVFELVEQGQQLHGSALKARLFNQLAHHCARWRVAYVAPAPRQGPESVAALLHQQQPARVIQDQRPHIQLGGGITAVQSNPVGDGLGIQLALAGDKRGSRVSQRLEAGDIEGILGVGEPGLSRGQHLFQKGGQRRLHG